MKRDSRKAPRIPSTLGETLSTDWLSAALSTRYPGLQIEQVVVGEVVSRMSTNARFEITVAGELPDGLPSTLCVKGYFSEYGQRPMPVGYHEAMFYRDLVGTTGVRTLRPQYADGDPETYAAVVISDDLIAGGGEFLDTASDYSPDDAALSLEQLAQLHIRTWMKGECLEAGWLDPWFGLLTAIRGVEEIRSNFESDIGAGVPTTVRSAERLFDAQAMVAAEATAADPWCVVHGDPHAANLVRTHDGRPGLVDWQVAQRGPWYLDVGYHLACALNVEDRRSHERDLARLYLDHLAAAGLPVPVEREAWNPLCRGMVHGLYLWGITLVVKPEITSVMLERLGTAVDDHDAFGALGIAS